MYLKIIPFVLLFFCRLASAQYGDYLDSTYGELLPVSNDQADLWWASSGWKISPAKSLPQTAGSALTIRAARREAEAAQLVIRPRQPLSGFSAQPDKLTGPSGAVIPAESIDVLRVRYVNVTTPTDKSTVVGLWPDPLPPFQKPINLDPHQNQPLWVRVTVPSDALAGTYTGTLRLTAQNYHADVPLRVEVYDFTLPEKMTCTTAFGFSADNVFRYQNLTDDRQKRQVLDKYWANFSAHHISPYDPAPMDPIRPAWPEVTASTSPADIMPSFDWTAWDKAMTRAIDFYHFNSFRLSIPGLGGGTYHSRTEPSLLGFTEDTPQYQAAFNAYCRAVQEHLRQKGWLDEAFVYWFDEPEPKDYEFVMNGFAKLKQAAPNLNRMLTEQPETPLYGGPNIYCVISNLYQSEISQQRRDQGDKFWWYICTGPKAPYCTLFIDHPGTVLRVWLWQTWQRHVEGILVWQSNYWTSSVAYPDPEHPQNPYEDPMGWVSGYSTPAGAKHPWGNGDGRFIYPPEAAAAAHPAQPVLDGPVDSIRWELLRDGIEDYEYLALLKRLLASKKDKLTPDRQNQLAALLNVPEIITKDMTRFTTDPAPIENHRDALARAIEILNKL